MRSLKFYLLAFAINAVALALLYHGTRYVDADLRYAQLDQIHQLKVESLLLDRDLFRLNFGQLNNYDTLADGQRRRDQMLQDLKAMTDDVHAASDVQDLLSRAIAIAGETDRTIDLIKRAHSQLKNSQAYFPVLIEDLVKLAAADPKTVSLARCLFNLKDVIAIHAFVQSAETQKTVDDMFQDLQSRRASLVADRRFLEDFDHAIEHARIIATKVGEVRDLAEKHLRSEFSEIADQIYVRYAALFAREQARSQDLFPFYYAVLIVLIGQVALMFFQLLRTNREVVRQAVELRSRLDRECELNGLQRQFVSMVSHEFRTPLAVIDAHAYRLQHRIEKMKPEALEKTIDTIRLSIRRLVDLIESVLSAAHLEEGKIKFDPARCDLAALVTEVCDNYAEINADHRLIVDIDKGLPPITADAKLLRQVLSNLISNAVKYSAAGSRVWVKSELSGGSEILVSVRDEGVGIPAEEQAKLFERFFRASTSVGIMGTGRGLHLAQHLATLHQGRIEVESEVDKGTTFYLRLPASLASNELDDLLSEPSNTGQLDAPALPA